MWRATHATDLPVAIIRWKDIEIRVRGWLGIFKPDIYIPLRSDDPTLSYDMWEMIIFSLGAPIWLALLPDLIDSCICGLVESSERKISCSGIRVRLCASCMCIIHTYERFHQLYRRLIRTHYPRDYLQIQTNCDLGGKKNPRNLSRSFKLKLSFSSWSWTFFHVKVYFSKSLGWSTWR